MTDNQSSQSSEYELESFIEEMAPRTEKRGSVKQPVQ